MRRWLSETPSSLNPTDPLTLLYQARHYDNATLLDMRDLPGVTAYAAERGHLTGTTPRDPGSPLEFLRKRRLHTALGTIAARTTARFAQDYAFAGAAADGSLPWVLAGAFNTVINTRGKDVHLINHRNVGGRQDADVVIGETTLGINPEDDNSEELAYVIERLLHKSEVMPPSVRYFASKRGRPGRVIIGGKNPNDVLSEHDIRGIGRALDVSIMQWFLDHGMYFPDTKGALQDWLDEGETFHAFQIAHMRRVIAEYGRIATSASYVGHPDLAPIDRGRPLGHDASGTFQRLRDIINGLGWDIRGSSAYNLEQDPNPKTRISLEEGIRLRRAAITEEQER